MNDFGRASVELTEKAQQLDRHLRLAFSRVPDAMPKLLADTRIRRREESLT